VYLKEYTFLVFALFEGENIFEKIVLKNILAKISKTLKKYL
jgi:hypothetical protein